MISVEYAKKIGITYCADLMGRDFVAAYADCSTTAFNETENDVFCFLGIDNSGIVLDPTQNLILTNKTDQIPYRASCHVSLIDGTVTDAIYIHPEEELLQRNRD